MVRQPDWVRALVTCCNHGMPVVGSRSQRRALSHLASVSSTGNCKLRCSHVGSSSCAPVSHSGLLPTIFTGSQPCATSRERSCACPHRGLGELSSLVVHIVLAASIIGCFLSTATNCRTLNLAAAFLLHQPRHCTTLNLRQSLFCMLAITFIIQSQHVTASPTSAAQGSST